MTTTAPAPRRFHVLRLAGASLRVDGRTLVVCVLLVLVALAAGLLALSLGDLPLALDEVLRALVSDADRSAHLIVTQWRAPRVVASLVLGAGLGVSGAVFQSVTRNPLGSPDVIGFTTGAYTGALVVILVTGGGFAATAGGALIGGIGTAVVVYLLAYRRGMQGFRLIVVGIAVSAMLASVNSYLITRANLGDAMSAAVWGAGSLNGMAWDRVGPACLTYAALLLPTSWLARRMAILELGDDAASALGVRTDPTRLGLVVVGVAWAAVATAVAGPIAFVALAAPQLARRLTGSAGVRMAPAACMGAVLLSVSDLVAQHALGDVVLPVGVVTVCLGGAYLVWLVIREARR